MPSSKKLYVKTYGCQMNVYDSERMGDALRPLGYAPVDAPELADVVILNTCHIRERAADKVFSELGKLRDMKAARRLEGKRMQIAVAGCVAQAEGTEIARRSPAVDVVVGPQSYHRLPELLFRAQAEGRTVLDAHFPAASKFDALPSRIATGQGPAAYLTVQEGCDKFCTFCVVPYTRGAEYSRPATQILDEARRLLALGARELTLLGQNVNAYHGVGPDGAIWGLGRLIRRIAKIDGLSRLRYTTSHPRDMDDDLIAAHADEPKLMPYLHLPVQSGSDSVLEAMNRGHTADDYRRLVERMRKARSDIVLSSDFIVGFPGETDGDFEATMALVREVGFAQAYSFKYSPRPGTPAAIARKQIADNIKTDRLAALQELLAQQAAAFLQSSVGQTVDVLFEGPGRHSGQLIGRSPYLHPVHARAPQALIGKISSVRLTKAMTNSMTGELLSAVAA